MQTFEYKAKTDPKKTISGLIEADSEQDAIQRILKLGQTPLEVKLQIKAKPKPILSAHKTLQASIRVPLSTVAIFTRQMADMVDAGIPLLKCLEILLNQKQHPSMKKVITSMHGSVKDGSSLSTALSQHPQVFPLLYVNMVKSAELGGFLPQVLNRLADFIEKDLQIKGQVKGGLLYPGIILVIGFLTMFVLLSFVMPRLTVMFDDFDTALPFPTRLVIAASSFFSHYWWIMAGIILLAVFYLKNFLKTTQGKLMLEEIVLKIPILRDFIQDVETAHFARTMATLLESGVTISSALESVSHVVSNVSFKQELTEISKKVQEGVSLSLALKKSKFFSETAINLISVGEESGKLERGLYKLAQMNERVVAQTTQNFVTILGPAILVLVVSFVGFIIISMLMPMFKINMIIN